MESFDISIYRIEISIHRNIIVKVRYIEISCLKCWRIVWNVFCPPSPGISLFFMHILNESCPGIKYQSCTYRLYQVVFFFMCRYRCPHHQSKYKISKNSILRLALEMPKTMVWTSGQGNKSVRIALFLWSPLSRTCLFLTTSPMYSSWPI